jgi:organic radical activating enzyme
MYCRFCTRKRKVGDKEYIPSKEEIKKGIDYIKKTPTVRDVLLSGGDPLMLSDDYLDWILTQIKNIPSQKLFEKSGYKNESSSEGDTIKVNNKLCMKDYYKPGRHFILYAKEIK